MTKLQDLRDYLAHRTDAAKVLTSTGWLFSDRVLRLIVSVLVGAWVARYLGTQHYGQLSIAQSYLILIAPVLKFGLDNVIIQRIVEAPDQRDHILGTAFAIRIGASMLMLPALALFVLSVEPADSPIVGLVVIVAIGAVLQSAEIIEFYFRSQVEARAVVLVRNAALTVSSLGKIAAILLGADVQVFAWMYTLDLGIFGVGLLLAYNTKERRLGALRFSRVLAWDLMRTSWPLIVAGLGVAVYMRVDQLMLAYMIGGEEGDAAVGVYAAAVRIAELWYFVPTVIIASVFPVILETRQQSHSLYLKRLQRLFNLMVLISYAFALGITLFGGWIVTLLYGPAYQESAALLSVLVWSGVWVSLGLARTPVLHAENRLSFGMWSTLAGAVVNVVMNALLIPPLGAMGCALATLVAQIFAAHLSTIIYQPVRRFGAMQTYALIMPNPLKVQV